MTGGRWFLLVVSSAIAISSCSAAPAGQSQVRVAIEDYRINATPATVPAGEIKLNITNTGGTLHEVEVFTLPAGVDSATIPVDHFLAQTDSVGMTVVDGVEGIQPNSTPSLTLTLAAGRYALICNVPTHYSLGMHTTLTVQ